MGYVAAFVPSAAAAQGVPPIRAAAVKLLVAYMGATLGSLYAVRAFVEEAVHCYRRAPPLSKRPHGVRVCKVRFRAVGSGVHASAVSAAVGALCRGKQLFSVSRICVFRQQGCLGEVLKA